MNIHHRQIILLGCLVLACIALFPPRRATGLPQRAATSTRPLSRVFLFSGSLPFYWGERDGDECDRPKPREDAWDEPDSSGASKWPAIVDAGRLLAEALLVIVLTAAWLARVGYRSAAIAFQKDLARDDGVDPDAVPIRGDGDPLHGTADAPSDPNAKT